MTTLGTADTVKLHVLVDRAIETYPPPEEGRRDTRRQSIVRAIETLSKEKDGPLRLKGDLVILYE